MERADKQNVCKLAPKPGTEADGQENRSARSVIAKRAGVKCETSGINCFWGVQRVAIMQGVAISSGGRQQRARSTPFLLAALW